MGLFSSNKREARLNWKGLDSIDQLNEIIKAVDEKPILIFKHSTRCGISAMALNSFERNWTSENELCELYFVDLLKHRSLSDEIATITGVHHQSPQVIVIKGKEIIYDASHSSIDGRRIESLLRKG